MQLLSAESEVRKGDPASPSESMAKVKSRHAQPGLMVKGSDRAIVPFLSRSTRVIWVSRRCERTATAQGLPAVALTSHVKEVSLNTSTSSKVSPIRLTLR
jgi:hypothetical protein